MTEQPAPNPSKAMIAHLLTRSTNATDHSHPYLVASGVKAHGIRIGQADPSWPIAGLCLIVPVRDEHGKVMTLVAIDATGTSYFWPGISHAGGHHPIGKADGDAPLVLAINYATAAKAHEATGWPVINALDAHNIGAVAEWVSRRHEGRTVIVVGDEADRLALEEASNLIVGVAICQAADADAASLAVSLEVAARAASVTAPSVSQPDEAAADVWQADLDAALAGEPIASSGSALASDILAMIGSENGRRDQMRVAAALRVRGWTRRLARVDGKRGQFWFAPGKASAAEALSQPVAEAAQ